VPVGRDDATVDLFAPVSRCSGGSKRQVELVVSCPAVGLAPANSGRMRLL